jgi:copper homeostasis protein
MRAPPLLEICFDSVEAAVAAAEGGADRLELCAGLVEGGTTPSRGAIELALERVRVPIVVLVRPRRGDFLYSKLEIATIERDIDAAKAAGAAGVALGVLRADGTIDVENTRALVARARPLAVTFHRAFDFVRDARLGLETLIELGVERVLTSGGAVSAEAGAESIAKLVGSARGRIAIVAGGGVRAHNVKALVERTGVREVHGTARELVDSEMVARDDSFSLDASVLPGAWQLHMTRADRVRELRRALETS